MADENTPETPVPAPAPAPVPAPKTNVLLNVVAKVKEFSEKLMAPLGMPWWVLPVGVVVLVVIIF